MFCKTKHGSNRVGQYLERAGVKAAVIHGNKSQGARTRALADFKAGRVTVLVATDIAARGLDIVQLPLVVNFDLPLVRRRLHPSRRPHRPRRSRRPRGVAGLAGRSRSAARHPAPAAGAGRARRAGRLPGDGLVARGAARGRASSPGWRNSIGRGPRSGRVTGPGYGRRPAARSGPSGGRPQPHGSAARHR